MSNSDATKNKVITEKWRFLVVTLSIIFHAIIVGKKTLKLFHIRVLVIIMPTLTLVFKLVSAQHIVIITNSTKYDIDNF